jgi:hypothetical protein
VLGALPRIRRGFRARDFFWMAVGLALLANSRPYEGLLVSVPALIAVAWWIYKQRPQVAVLVRRVAPAGALLALTLASMAYYDYRVFGNPLTLPYTVNRRQYASAPHFIFQSAHPEPVYRHAAMQNFYTGWELKTFRDEVGSVAGFAEAYQAKFVRFWMFFLNFAFLPPLCILPWALRDRRMRLWAITTGVLAVGLSIETFFIPHYLAPATAVIYVILLQCMRHLRMRGPSGLFLVRAIPVVCFVLMGARILAQPLHIALEPPLKQSGSWDGGAPSIGIERAQVKSELESRPGPQIAIVRYAHDHLYPEWVYNAADLEDSKIIWAREMGPTSDQELLNHYKDRTAWLVEADLSPPRVTRYQERATQTARYTFPPLNIGAHKTERTPISQTMAGRSTGRGPTISDPKPNHSQGPQLWRP